MTCGNAGQRTPRAVSGPSELGRQLLDCAMVDAEWAGSGQNGHVSTGQDLLDELRRQRRGGDTRITPEGREILTRIVMGDLADEFADSLG